MQILHNISYISQILQVIENKCINSPGKLPETFCMIFCLNPTSVDLQTDQSLSSNAHATFHTQSPWSSTPPTPTRSPQSPQMRPFCWEWTPVGLVRLFLPFLITPTHFLPATHTLRRSSYPPHEPSGYGLQTQCSPPSRFQPLKSSFPITVVPTNPHVFDSPNNTSSLSTRHSTPMTPPYFNHVLALSLLPPKPILFGLACITCSQAIVPYIS